VQKTQRIASPLEETIANIVLLHFCTHEQAMDAADNAYFQLLYDEVLLLDFLALAPANSTPMLWLIDVCTSLRAQ
jgi:hypothetical protein